MSTQSKVYKEKFSKEKKDLDFQLQMIYDRMIVNLLKDKKQLNYINKIKKLYEE
jgi:hypothetical protein